MIVDLVRQVRAWLDDAASGVDALRADTPREPGADPPPAVTIVDQNTTAWAQRGEVPIDDIKSGPHVIVRIAQVDPFGATPFEQPPTPTVTAQLLVVLRDSASHTGGQDVEQILRNALRALVLPWVGPPMLKHVDVNGVRIRRPTAITRPDLANQIPSPLLGAAAHVLYPVSDPWSLGASL